HSRTEDGDWQRHASGTLLATPVEAAPVVTEWPPAGATELPVEEVYQALATAGLAYGPAFQGLRTVWRDGDTFYAEAALPEALREEAGRFGLHPALLDAALQLPGLAEVPGGGSRLPFAYRRVALHAAGAAELRVRLSVTGPEEFALLATDADGSPVVSIGSLVTRAVTAERLTAPKPAHGDSLFTVEWSALELPGAAAPRQPVHADRAALGPADLAGAWVAVRAAGEPAPEAADVPARLRSVLADTLALAQEWVSEEHPPAARLVVVTTGAVAVGPDETPDPVAASVWGLLRSAQTENPDRIVLLDLDEHPDSAEVLSTAVTAALAADENQLALRAGAAHLPRLVRAGVAASAGREWDPAGTVLIT
ncbi:polyketide synthase dehydratase domain-containing protein, partial [Kitasatospora indigofera]|uniref:polyketide synthase dehydratase domain-containing protein n=1 Tax=Kitasatospora indigofera TaxID=67307 RepID=UPI00167CF83A